MVRERSIPPVRAELQEVIARLKGLQSTIAVAVGALRHQNADIDADIANLLQHSVGDTLAAQVQKLEALLSRLPRSSGRHR
jgi:hypothetical protein